MHHSRTSWDSISKSELEDLSLKYLEHDAYYHIKRKAERKQRKNEMPTIKQFIEPVGKALQNAGLRFHIKRKNKSRYTLFGRK